MAKFNPTLDPVINSGAISASRGIEDNKAFGELFAGIGRTLQNTANAWMDTEQTAISLQTNSAVEEVAQQRLSDQETNKIEPKDLPGVQAGINDASRHKAAYEAGKIPASHYYAVLASKRKDLIAAHPGFADVIDRALSGALGSNVGWDLANQLDQESNQKMSALDSEVKFNRQFAKDNADEIQRAVEAGLLPADADYIGGNYDINKVYGITSKFKAEKSRIEAMNAQVSLDGKLAVPAAQQAIDRYNNEVFSASSTQLKSFMDVESKALQDGKLTDEERAQIRDSLNILSRELPIGARKVLEQYPNLSPDERKGFLAQTQERLDDIKSFWNNPDWGVFAAEERAMKDALVGEQSKLMSMSPTKAHLAMLKLGFSPDVATAVTPNIVNDLRNNILLRSGTSLGEAGVTLQQEGKTPKEVAQSISGAIKQATSDIINSGTSPEALGDAVNNLFGSKKAVNFLNDYVNADNRIDLFNMLVNPKMTEKLKGTKYFQDYSAFAMKQFVAITEPLVNGERQHKDDYANIHVYFDPKSNHFMLDAQAIPNNVPIIGGMGKFHRELDYINKYIDLVDPIVKANGGNTTEWLQNVLVRDFNDRGSNIIMRMLDSVKKSLEKDVSPTGGNVPASPSYKGKQSSISPNDVLDKATAEAIQKDNSNMHSVDTFLHSVSDKPMGAIEGLNDQFATNLADLFQVAPPEIREGLGIYSGKRDTKHQAELFRRAVIKYGSYEAARKWVAPPGHSQHEKGNAVDLAWHGESLADAPAWVVKWVHQHAPEYGLTFPLSNENWHIEPIGARKKKKTTASK